MKKILLISILLAFGTQISFSQFYKQEKNMWCWASCIQSALIQANVSQSQSQIVTRLAAWPQNRPATAIQVSNILRSYGFKSWTVGRPGSAQELYNTLISGWKLIAFVNPTDNPQIGHFIMLQGVSPRGLIIVSDPTYGNTYEQNIQQLYFAWKWSHSVVVGTP